MAKRQAAATSTETEEKADAPVEETEEKADDTGSATVTYPGGTRTYSKEVHGKDYKKHAKEFAEKKGGKVA